MQRFRNQTAFTLIEALIAVAIISLLFHTAIPALGSVLQRHQLTTLSDTAMRLMYSARLEALSRARAMTWCPLNNQNRCNANDATRLIVFEDSNSNQRLDDDEPLLVQTPLTRHQRVIMANKDTVRFITNGRTYQPTSIHFCEGDIARKITISFTGRIYQQQTSGTLACPN